MRALGLPAASAWDVLAAKSDPRVSEILRQVLTPRHPSQLYEALLEGVILFAVLWYMRTRMKVPRGVITGSFFMFYAVLRIIAEMFREPDQWTIGPVTAGQLLSVALILIGVAFVIYGMKTRKYERAAKP
jgi:phosphatidylglycerol:prolipoprotein diacylglycerol transferase